MTIQISETIHTRAGGGIGDLIYSYFTKKQWQLVSPVKKVCPSIINLAVLTCHASSARELVELHPDISAILTYPWFPPGHDKEKEWKKLIITKDITQFAEENKIEPDPSIKVYLSPLEEAVLKSFTDLGKYVVIHPFAGLPHRGCMPHPYDGKYKCFPDYRYIEAIEILSKQGIPVVILGRTEKDTTIRSIKEILSVGGPNIHNLIDNASLRLSVAITRSAGGFIGSHSSMLSAAWTNSVPSIYFYPTLDEHGNKRSVLQHGGETGSWAYHKPWTFCFEMPSDELINLSAMIVVDKLKELMK